MNRVSVSVASAFLVVLGSAVGLWSLIAPALSTPSVASNPFANGNPSPSWPEPSSAEEVGLFDTNKARVRLPIASPQSLYAKVGYDYTQKTVLFDWYYRGTGNAPLISMQSEAVRFVPTDVAVEGADKLLVAGFDPASGQIVIERWTFQAPSPFPGPSINPQTGEVTEPYIAVRISAKDVVMRIEGMDPIWKLFVVHGDVPRMYAIFLRSRGIGLLDPIANMVTPLWAPVATPGAQVVSGLDQLNGDRWSAEHQVAGYVYSLGRVLQSDQYMMIIDSDKDGQIDLGGLLSGSELQALEIPNGDRYTTWF